MEGFGRGGSDCTGEEPDDEEDEDGGAQVGRENLELGEAQRHETWEVELRRRVGVGSHCRRRRLDLESGMERDENQTAVNWGVGTLNRLL
jgi:hypothetical protein